MKISTRLSIGFGLTVLMLITCTITSLRTLSFAQEQAKLLDGVQMEKYEAVVAMRSALREIGLSTRNTILFTDTDDLKPEWKNIEDQKNIYSRNLNTLKKIMLSDPTPEGQAAMQRILSNQPKTMKAIAIAAQMGMKNQAQEAIVYLKNTVQPAQNEMMDALDAMTKVQMNNNHNSVHILNQKVSAASVMLYILTTLSTLASVLCGYFVTRSLMRQLGSEPEVAQALAATIASGDLTSSVTLRRNDTTSLLASLNTMQAHLRELVSQIKQSAESVALASEEIAQGNTELSARTEQQAAALQETAASMEQLTSTVKSNTSNAQQTVNSAREAVSLARTGEADVKNMTDTMKDISLSASKVRDITDIIEGIAFQTNILALNAAVEAARAGEEGRGFAVVAGEVRTLAQRSASAAKEIKELTEKSVEVIESGVTVADRTSQSIMKVVGMVGALGQAMEEISMASTEQMQGISQVTIAVNEMDGVTQSNAALVEESSTASLSLSEQAHSLSNMVGAFAV